MKKRRESMKYVSVNEIFLEMNTIAAQLFCGLDYPWEALSKIESFIIEIGKGLSPKEFYSPKEGIWIARDSDVFDSAYIAAPCIIDRGANVRHCAFLRGGVIVGKNAVVGNSTEIKNSVLFDEVQAPHYNYIGDSILGYRAHMGAGSITSNVKSDRLPVFVKFEGEAVETGRKKFGAMIGDGVEIGCGSVLNPGSVIGPYTNIYPLSSVRGVVPPNSIYKAASEIVKKRSKTDGQDEG